MAEVCVLCNLISCVPGFYSSGCAPGSVRDAVCLPCSNAPRGGPYNWTSACDFECLSPGYWLNGTECSDCSVLNCLPGFYPSECGGTNNSQCVPCPLPNVSGPIKWTNGCEFTCSDGFFFSREDECHQCSDTSCFPGYVKTACTERKDSECLECDEPAGLFGWTQGCEYVCMTGHYLSEAGGCIACSSPECLPGTYVLACNETADSSCARCTDPEGEGFVWTNGCEHACAAGQYWFDGAECRRCASGRLCDPGWERLACTQDSDSDCVQCVQTQAAGSFEWTDGCQFSCVEGFFRSNGQCLQCSVPECGPGTFAIDCTDASDATCAKCNPPPGGGFVWTSACAFECASGFFMENGTCSACSSYRVCEAGFRPSACTLVRDVACEPCQAPMDGSFVWTVGCEFSCAGGHYFNNGACRRCSDGPCAAGTYPVDCTAYSDLVCLECSAPSGGYFWTTGCGFECVDGYFKDGAAICSPCSEPRCGPGTYLKNCSSSSDAVCVRCNNAPAEGFAWTDGCEFKCVQGYFQDQSSVCAACSSPLCSPGTFQVACSEASDAKCVPCVSSMGMESFVWTDAACGFKCADGYYRVNASFCSKCFNSSCGPGYFRVGCSASADSYCAQCSGGGRGVVWGVDCQFDCGDGYVRDSTGCVVVSVVIPTQQQVFAVVNTQMALENTVSEICKDLVALMAAMSRALSVLSNSTVQFETNVTVLDGQTCVENKCPQCGSLNFTARRLLADGSVPITVVSQSTVPVEPSAVVQPSSTSLLSVLVQSLDSSALFVGDLAATVSTRAVAAESAVVFSFSDFFLVFVILLFVLSCAVCLCCAACIKRCCEIRQYEDKRSGPGMDSFFSVKNNPRVSLSTGRVEAITFRRRSRSRDRDLSLSLL